MAKPKWRERRPIRVPADHQQCARCGKVLPHSAFGTNHRKGKLFRTCEDCRTTVRAQRNLNGIGHAKPPPGEKLIFEPLYQSWMARPPTQAEGDARE